MSEIAERKQGRRSAQDAENTKRRIMYVAALLFCEHGYDKVSLRNISEKAGVSHSLIRHHFGSKEKIWQSISDYFHEYMERYRDALIEQLGDKLALNEFMYQFSIRMVALMLVQPAPIQLIADAVRQQTDELVDYFISTSDQMQVFFIELAEKHNREFPQRPINIHEFKWQMLLYAHGAASLRPFMAEIWPDKLDINERLLAHWKMFENYAAQNLGIAPAQRSQPEKLADLVLLDLVDCFKEEGFLP